MPLIPLFPHPLGGPVVTPNPVTTQTYRAVRFAYENLITASPGSVSLTASSEAFGYPVQNLASRAVWQKWRSASGNSAEWIKADMFINRGVRAMMVKNAKGFTGGRIRLQANDTDTWTAPHVDEIVSPGSGDSGVMAAFVPLGTYRYARVLFENLAATLEYVELGVWFVGDYYEPPVSIAPGWAQSLMDSSVTSVSTGGQKSVDRRSQFWRIQSKFAGQPESERAALVKLQRNTGTHTPLFFVIDGRNPSQYSWYGRFDSGVDLTHITTGVFSQAFNFTEDV